MDHRLCDGSKIQIVWYTHQGLYQFLFTFHLVMIYHLRLNRLALIYEFVDFTDTASKNCLAQKAYPFRRW